MLPKYSVKPPAHPLLPDMVDSAVIPHISALEDAGVYKLLKPEIQAVIIRLMQTAYQNGRAAQHAEKIDNDAVWIDEVGLLEKQPDGTWKQV